MSRRMRQARKDTGVVFFGILAVLISLATGWTLGNFWFGLCLAAVAALLAAAAFMAAEETDDA